VAVGAAATGIGCVVDLDYGCGDGVVRDGEACDPAAPISAWNYDCDSSATLLLRVEDCSDTCELSVSPRQYCMECGNGVIEGRTDVDDETSLAQGPTDTFEECDQDPSSGDVVFHPDAHSCDGTADCKSTCKIDLTTCHCGNGRLERALGEACEPLYLCRTAQDADFCEARDGACISLDDGSTVCGLVGDPTRLGESPAAIACADLDARWVEGVVHPLRDCTDQCQWDTSACN